MPKRPQRKRICIDLRSANDCGDEDATIEMSFPAVSSTSATETDWRGEASKKKRKWPEDETTEAVTNEKAKAESKVDEKAALERKDSLDELLEIAHLEEIIVQAAQSVYNALGPGLSEGVYRDALQFELELQRCFVSGREVLLPVYYKERYVGFCRSDLVLLLSDSEFIGDEKSNKKGSGKGSGKNNKNKKRDREEESVLRDGDGSNGSNKKSKVPPPKVVIELKAIKGQLASHHVQQLSAYMRLLNTRRGFLVNFVQGDSAIQRSLVSAASSFSAARHSAACSYVTIESKREKEPIQVVSVAMQ